MSARLVVGAAAAGILALAGGLIATWEGYQPKPYQDIVGVWTVCYGHTGNVEQRTYTKAQCDSLLRSDMGQHLNGISNCIHRTLKDNETAAVLSLAFNVGYPAVCRSTMVRKINAGAPPAEFCRELFKWVYAGGRKVKGLERRRAAEFKLCMGYAQ